MKKLETVEKQIDFLVNMADGKEDELVKQSLEDAKELPTMYTSLVEAWKEGDEKALSKLMTEELKEKAPEVYNSLLVERNKNWLPRIEVYQPTPQTEFSMVGTAHLVGPDGIIATLKAIYHRKTMTKPRG